jgi:hypothetical protein
LRTKFQENYILLNPSELDVNVNFEFNNIPIEISEGKIMNINSQLDSYQWEKLIKVLQVGTE